MGGGGVWRGMGYSGGTEDGGGTEGWWKDRGVVEGRRGKRRGGEREERVVEGRRGWRREKTVVEKGWNGVVRGGESDGGGRKGGKEERKKRSRGFTPNKQQSSLFTKVTFFDNLLNNFIVK